MPPTFTGSLQPKKKLELQEIAIALRLSDQGTKDELHARIKKHLDTNQATLEDDPSFAGLFGRRKRSVQPQSVPSFSRFAPPETAPQKPSSSKVSVGRRVVALDPIRESTPATELGDVSTLLKRQASPIDSTPAHSPQRAEDTTPSSLPALPPSPPTSVVRHTSATPRQDAVVLRTKQQDMLQNSRETLIRVRHFLSNSQTLWSLSAILEFMYILSTVIPWKYIQLPLSPASDHPYSLIVAYPPWHTFQMYTFWLVIMHWAIPTLVIPAIVGNLISFTPNSPPSYSGSPLFDPLTASIVRLAAHVAYPFSVIEQTNKTTGLDVLGFKWRVLNASVGVAFSFAEAIAGAPEVFARTLAVRRRHDQAGENTITEAWPPSNHQSITDVGYDE